MGVFYGISAFQAAKVSFFMFICIDSNKGSENRSINFSFEFYP